MDWFFPDILWYNGANTVKHHLIFFSWLNISFYFSYNYSYVFPLWSIFDSLLCLLIVGNYNFLPVEIAYYLSHQYVLGNDLLLNNYLNMDFSFFSYFPITLLLIEPYWTAWPGVLLLLFIINVYCWCYCCHQIFTNNPSLY